MELQTGVAPGRAGRDFCWPHRWKTRAIHRRRYWASTCQLFYRRSGAPPRGFFVVRWPAPDDHCERLKAHGIPVYDSTAVHPARLYVDGLPTETNRHLELDFKGGGAALTRGKRSVRRVAHTFSAISRREQAASTLWASFPLPRRGHPHGAQATSLGRLSGWAAIRSIAKAGVTDKGNVILDVHNMQIP